jgi:hypothetical protein
MNTSFDRAADGKSEWLTPPEILRALGPFDLDPCAPVVRPWPMAGRHYTTEDNGLLAPWCNPPYGSEGAAWLAKCADHGHAIALIFARTETSAFFEHIWKRATCLLFLRGRLSFHHVNGDKGGTAGAPSVLVAYGDTAAERLRNCGLKGALVDLFPSTVNH